MPWLNPVETQVPAPLQEAVGGHPLVAQTLVRRGLADPSAALAFLDPRRYAPAPPEDFPGMQQACKRIEHALKDRERISVWGDFDVDGQTSTALLVEVLRSLGGEPGYHIPVRARESHGINIPNLKLILEKGADLLITCDTGITAHDALAYAQERGLDVIVTDHHALGESLPPALAHITPRLLPPGHPLGTLPGVGAAYKLAEALLTRADRADEAKGLLDLVALGIVADLAVQTGDARYLLQRGLETLRHTERPGLHAIMELAEVDPGWLSEEHIAFAIAPRLNALGRLDDANPAVELLTTHNPQRARALAQQLEGLNARRQLLTRQVLQSALKQIERDPALLDPPVLVLSNPEWPAGVIGITASELVERYQRPVLLLASPKEAPARGSARSVDGIDITACIATQRELLLSFGGHPMAAGLALDPANLPAFRRGLARAVSKMLKSGGVPPEASLILDGDIRLDELSLDLVADFERLAPFGAGNPPLIFAVRDLSLASAQEIGREREHLLLTVEDRAGLTQKALWWGGAAWPRPEGRFDLACKIRSTDFRGQRDLQVEWVDFRPLTEPAVEITTPRREIIDHRGAVHPRTLLEELRSQGEVCIWAEGEARARLDGMERGALVPAQVMAIWTAPAGRAELLSALAAVHPQVVALFGLEPETTDPQAFLARLTGLVKFVLNKETKGSEVDLTRLAGATAQRENAVRCGLEWLAASGHIRLEEAPGGALFLHLGSGQPTTDPGPSLTCLKSILEETAAYRRHFRGADPGSLGLT
jgi:single-stranded-DNA-specific exonuclease